MAEEKRHCLQLEERTRMVAEGVTDVLGFEESLITMETDAGPLAVRGTGLHIEKLDLENGRLIVTGEVSALEYEEIGRERGGFFGRLFG